jgi:HSP90 family molecular chaperone
MLHEARLMQGASVEDPLAFAARLRRVMEKALG